jgi:anti-anti-sigma factor
VTRSNRPRRPLVEVEEVGPVTVVHVREQRLVDEPLVQLLGRELTALVGRPGRATLLLDFAEVEYLSSMIIATLMKLQQKVTAAQNRLALCALRPEVAEILSLTGVHRVFKVFATEQQALAGL